MISVLSKKPDNILKFNTLFEEIKKDSKYDKVMLQMIVSPHTIIIKGIMPFSEDIYVFINGKYNAFKITDT